MRQLVDQGVDAIIVCCSNPTALNQTVEYAHDKGVPVFSGIGYLTSPYAINASANFVVGGRMMGDWMAKEIGGKGNVLVVEGIPGTPASDSQNTGIQAALAEYPDVPVVGQIAGMWADQGAQAEIQKWMATSPGQLDGIIIQSASELGALCQWRHNPDFVSGAIHEDCSEDSDQWYHPGIEAWAGKACLDNFFLRSADPEAYDPASHPKP